MHLIVRQIRFMVSRYIIVEVAAFCISAYYLDFLTRPADRDPETLMVVPVNVE